MYTCRMITQTVLEVVEVLHGALTSTKLYFNTNIETWEDLTNPAATEQEGDFKVARKLDEASIRWTKKNYLPKVDRA